MSATVIAYGGIGFLIWMNDDMTWPTVARESCEHAERIGAKFCPVCGVKVESIVEEQGAREGYVEFFQKTNPDETRFLCETVYHDTNFDGWSYRHPNEPQPPSNDGVFIGFGTSAGSGDTAFTSLAEVPSAEDIREIIRNWETAAFQAMREAGFQPPNSLFSTPRVTFGLHVISYYN